MFVDVITVLVMTMSIVDVIDVSIVFYGLVTVTLGVNTVVVLVNHLFSVLLTIVNMINVTVVLDRLVTISRQVLMIGRWMSIAHLIPQSSRT